MGKRKASLRVIRFRLDGLKARLLKEPYNLTLRREINRVTMLVYHISK